MTNNRLTIVIPYRNQPDQLARLLDSLDSVYPVILVDDHSEIKPGIEVGQKGVQYLIRLRERRYFAGAVNAGIAGCDSIGRADSDVLILNQDSELAGREWIDVIESNRGRYALIGSGVLDHPAWPAGYVQGQFMFMRRDAIQAVGPLNEIDYPLWGNTCEWQIRAARKGFEFLPLAHVPGFTHHREQGAAYGESIAAALAEPHADRSRLIRTPPLVSVIIPTYNYGRYLPDAINSLIGGPTSLGDMPGQTLQSFEVIIVDDASTDDTEKIGKALADPAKGIRYLRRSVNGGTPAANNTGARAAFGRYLTVLCADDMRDSRALELLYRACESNPHSFAYDDVTLFFEGSQRHLDRKVWRMPEYDFMTLINKNQIHAGIMFPRQAWLETGGYPEAMRQGREDWAYNVALGLKGYCGVHVKEPGYLYRRGDQNRTNRNSTREWRDHFKDQMTRLFPTLYQSGELPKMCCGNSNTRNRSRALAPDGKGGGGAALLANGPIQSFESAAGVSIIEYLGGSSGPIRFTGKETKRAYVVSKKRNMITVDNRDVDGLLGLMENKRDLFRLAVMPDKPSVENATVAEFKPESFALAPKPGDIAITPDTESDPAVTQDSDPSADSAAVVGLVEALAGQPDSLESEAVQPTTEESAAPVSEASDPAPAKASGRGKRGKGG